MKVIKAYEVLVKECRENDLSLPFDDDLACAKFRAFYVEASLMTRRVRSPFTKNVMREILETLQSDLNID